MRALRSALALLACLGLLTLVLGRTASAGSAPGSPRSFKESLAAPLQFDLTLAELRFSGAHRPGSIRLARSRLRIAPAPPVGLYYLAGAVTRSAALRPPRALVLVVNRRPRGSLAPDLARIRIALSVPGRLGAPLLREAVDPFTRAAGARLPALCRLAPASGPLNPNALRPLMSSGVGLAGFSAQAAIAQAYDVVCGRPYDPAFKGAVTQPATSCAPPGVSCCPPAGPCCSPAAPCCVKAPCCAASTPCCVAPAPCCAASPQTLCCPPNAICAPPPLCPPCQPLPGHACPLVAAPNVCVAPARAASRAAGRSAR